VERLKMELTLRTDEMKKLQIESKDFSEYKLKYNQLEEKLLVEIKNNQVLQSKIDQSQQEMFSLLKIANNNKNDDATLSGYESYFEANLYTKHKYGFFLAWYF
jgi:hypothetical protein